MAVRADVISNRRSVRRAMQAVGFVALLILAVGAVLTASGAFAGKFSASSMKPAHAAYAPILTDTPTPTSTPNPCDPVWSLVSSPNIGSSSILNDVAVVTTNDLWAVGGHQGHTLIEHWDGTSWSVVPSPNVGTGNNTLEGVAAVSATDVWTVGCYNCNSSGGRTLVEHWDGTSWSVISSPNPGNGDHYLYGVAVVSATDVWAVGYYDSPSSPDPTIIEHWDGISWSVVPSPNPGGSGNLLRGITAVSANDVWAVGWYCTSNCLNSPDWRTLIEHWDGTSWSVVSSPNVGTSEIRLLGVSAVSANDVWAVGSYNNGGRTLIEHWDGTSWSVVSSPSGGTGNNQLSEVAAVSANDVWAVGYNGSSTLVEHWDGTAWSVPSSPSPSVYSGLSGIAVVLANDVWAVGTNANGSVYSTLVEHYATLCGTPTSTPTITRTITQTNTRTVTPTITPGGPTLTPTITGTPPTITPTSTPGPNMILGHLTWQGVAPANRPNVTGTLQLCVNGSIQTFLFTTDTSGNFAVTVGLPDGTYHWWIRGGRHISNSSPTDGPALVISNGHATLEFGMQRGGNFNPSSDNLINATDFNRMGRDFGHSGIMSADFDYNLVANALDFNIIRSNFGQAGHVLACP